MDIVVPASGPVEFTPVDPNALHVFVRDPEGAFARVGLRNGDWILSIDGEIPPPVRSVEWFGALMQGRETLALWIERDGTEHELVVDCATIFVADPGGSLTPGVR